MKSKFSILSSRLLYYFKHLFSSENPDNKSTLKKNKVVVENNLRWQDDGGPVVEIVDPADADAKKDAP